MAKREDAIDGAKHSREGAAANKKHKKHQHQVNGLSIPIQKIGKRWSTNASDDSLDSNGDGIGTGDRSPVSTFYKSVGGAHAASTMNVYSISPRNTSVLYQYYNHPKGYFESQGHLIHPAKNNGRYCNTEHSNGKVQNGELSRTTSECCEFSIKPTSPMLSSIPNTMYLDVMEDPRRRAWSESDSKKHNSMHISRLSALQRIKKKLGRSGSLKKKHEQVNESLNQSTASNNSLDRSDEQKLNNKSMSPRSSKRSTMSDFDIDEFSTLSVKPEDPNRRISSERLSDAQKSPAREPCDADSTNTELIYQRFLEEHTCYDIMPTSCKLLVFDTQLQARQAFHALIENAVRSAPLWDRDISCHVGMLTVTDFIKVILIAHRAENMEVESIEEQTIHQWRKLLNQKTSFASVHPDDTLLQSLKFLMNEHFHGVPIMDEATGDIFHVINHKRILRFLHLFMKELPEPKFISQTLADVKIGTYDNVATVTKRDTMLHVLEKISEQKVTALPVVDGDGEVIDVFCKLDMISLAAQGLYHDLSTTLDVALACRFKPLFEDEECPADTFTRFSSPAPQRKDLHVRRSYVGSDVRTRKDYHRSGNSAFRGHAVSRPTADRPPQPQRLRAPNDVPVTHECTGRKVRHKSLSNPLIKCQLTDTLQHIIDLLVKTEANLLVVVGQKSNHVIGVVTVSDVLYYIINPPGHELDSDSPSQHKRRSRHQFTSTSPGSAPLHGRPESSCVDDHRTSDSVAFRSRTSQLSTAESGGSTNEGVAPKIECSNLSSEGAACSKL